MTREEMNNIDEELLIVEKELNILLSSNFVLTRLS